MRPITLGNIFLKVILIFAVIYMFVFPDQPQFEGKSLTLRVIFYPLFALMIAIIYFLKKVKGSYPHLTDLLWTFPFAFDIVGNDLNFYNSYTQFDDFVHFVDALPFMFVLFAVLNAFEKLGKIKLGFWGISLFAFFIHGFFHSLWEIWEFSLDKYLGTFLQPGGMTEATGNNLAGFIGSLLAIAFLYFLRKNLFFQKNLLTPTQNLLG